jgi:cytochrome P450
MTSPPETDLPADIAPPWTVEGHRDPRPFFARMLAERPVAYDPKAGVWHLFRLTDVQAFYREPDDWSTARRLERLPPEQRFVRLLTSDPPLHQSLRQFFSHAYRPRRIESMVPRMRRVCAKLIDEALERGRLDISTDLASPLAATMIRDLIGVPEEDESRFPVLHGTLGHLESADDPDACMSLYMGGTEAEDQRAVSAYFEELVARRRAEPQDDMVSDLARIPADRFEERLDVGALLNEQLGAGQNTTMHLIGNMIWRLLDHPEELAKLRTRPELAESAVEETLRHASPLQARPRVSARPLRVHGVDIPDGATGLGWIQAANLDPEAFSEPHRFQIDRSPNHHIAFGYGEHFCLGAWLARRAARVTLEEWLARVGSFEALDPEGIEPIPDFLVRGPSALHVAVQPRT